MLAISILPVLAFASMALAAPASTHLDARVAISMPVVPAAGTPAGGSGQAANYFATGKCTAEIPGRLLKGESLASNDMSFERCARFCGDKRYNTFGVEYGRECYCSIDPDIANKSGESTNCNVPCAADSSQICGGGDALVIFKRNPTLTFPTRVTRNPTWTFNGQCNADSRENRQLTLALYEENMTWEICTAACDARGNDLAGIEFGKECYCGNAGTFNSQMPANSDGCQLTCKGNRGQLCGGPDALTILFKQG